MGNCQAADASMVVIQHPGGRVERWYWPISASEVMRNNPGHYIASVTICQQSSSSSSTERSDSSSTVRFTRVKILRAKDTLVLGHVYRLVTSQDVMKGLRVKKYAKMKKNQPDSESEQQQQQQEAPREASEAQVLDCGAETRKTESGNTSQDAKQERHRQKATHSAMRPSRQWRPSLQSISEVGS